MSTDKKFGKNTPKTNALRKALADRPAAKPVAAAATQPAKKAKPNPRTAKARDERAKARGRLPLWTQVDAVWNGTCYVGRLIVFEEVKTTPLQVKLETNLVKSFRHTADGLFRLMEELDVMFWNWFATATEAERARLHFAPDPPKPQPWVDQPVGPPTGGPLPPASAR